MKVEVRDKELHFLPESWNELVRAEWIITELRLMKDGMIQMTIVKPVYPPEKDGIEIGSL